LSWWYTDDDNDKIGDINETLSMISPYSQTLALHGVGDCIFSWIIS